MTEFLPGVPGDLVEAAIRRAPGNEMALGKFDTPESSAALAANAFGWFIERAALLPPLPNVPMGRPVSVTVPAEMHFPWRGGKQPWVEAAVASDTTLVGIVSRRYEPFRPQKTPDLALAHERDWGGGLERHAALRADMMSGKTTFRTLNAAQLLKQAYGLANQGVKQAKGTVLVYLYAEPAHWASGKPVDPALIARHRAEVEEFANRLRGDSVVFVPLRWSELLQQWAREKPVSTHAAAVVARFGPLW